MRKKIGIALGSGGARGLAHIGVLKVLVENDIPIDYVSGTSMGAVVGAFFCSGMSPKDMEKLALEINWKKAFDITLPTRGLVKGDRIEKLIRDNIGNPNFSDLKIPLFVSSYDIKNEEEIIFSKGNVARAVRASLSIPGVFVPVQNKDRVLVDGGVTDPLPSEILEDYSDITICSNVFPFKKIKIAKGEEAVLDNIKIKIPGVFESLSKSFMALNYIISDIDRNDENIDILIDIPTENIGLLDFKDIQKIINIGEDTTREKIEEIKKLVKPNKTMEFIKELKSGFEKNIGGLSDLNQNLKTVKRNIIKED